MVEGNYNQRAGCPVCSNPSGDPFVHIGDQPVHCNVLWDTVEDATASPRGDIDLVFCDVCGHIFNVSFDAERTTYGGTYENSLHHSAAFHDYASGLVDDLIERRGLRNKDIVEIGAGQGDFLSMLCDRGSNRGTGFDPSHVGPADTSDLVRVVRAFYSEDFAEYPADLVVCRHVLEHVDRSGDFVAMVRRVIGDRRAVAFFEVPNALWTLVEGGVWDVIYEHCGYFTPTSLGEAFRRARFDDADIGTAFGGQFLTIEAEPATTSQRQPIALDSELEDLRTATDRFAATYAQQVRRRREELRAMVADGRRAVIWGAGSKGVTFLNVVDQDRAIEQAVDVNPRKLGKFVAGSGQLIVEPASLVDSRPDVVFVMNPNYRDEIGTTLTDLGLRAELVVV